MGTSHKTLLKGMLFTEPIFLFYFLPLALLLHRLAITRRGESYPHAARLVIFLLTLVFYGYREPWWIAPFLVCYLLDYGWAWALCATKNAGSRRTLLIVSVTQNLCLLAAFKYWPFVVETLSHIAPGLGSTLPRFSADGAQLALPAGISFYTFESLSFVIDVYRGHVRPPKSPLDYGAFLAMFPRLIAGPIVRYRDVAAQFAKYQGMRVEAGLFLFCSGLFFKLALADSFAHFARFAFDPSIAPSVSGAWIGAIAFCLQLYFDFHGYSLMAMGLGRCLGLELPANFDRPYQATSLKEFWRRWHITLGLWVKDYLYSPLLGDRTKATPLRRYGALLATMLIVGIWHGTGWQFVAMGLWFGVIQCLERRLAWPSRLSPSLSRAITLFTVAVGWVFLRSPDFGTAARTLAAMVGFPSAAASFNPTALLANPIASWFAVGGILYCAAGEPDLEFPETLLAPDLARAVIGFGMLMTALTLAAPAALIPFVYFRF